jgi:hypothetical protein
MRKGFLASVAALAAGAGAALGQGVPGQPPNYPSWPGAGPGTPAYGPPAAYSTVPAGGMDPTAGYPGGPGPGGGHGLPPATEMPLNGPVVGPDCAHPSCGPDCGKPKHDKWAFLHKTGPQIHKAAGGPDRWYLDVEQLIWVPKPFTPPFPLVTASPPGAAGILGGEGTRILYGADDIDYGGLSALRLTGGVWDKARECGIELSGFIQEQNGIFANYAVPITAREALARPVIDALTQQPTALLVAFPGAFSGTLQVASTMQFGGAEANLLRSLLYCDRVKFNVLAGVRYIDLSESLNFYSRSLFPTIDPIDPNVVDIVDEFRTRNQFFGGQIGFQSELRHKRWFVDLTGKIGIGNMNERLVVNGQTNRQALGIPSSALGGLLALESNIGDFTRNEFAVCLLYTSPSPRDRG